MSVKQNSTDLREKKLDALGRKVNDLLDCVKSKKNVHGEIRCLVSLIRTRFDELSVIEDVASPTDGSEKATADTQTTPGLSRTISNLRTARPDIVLVKAKEGGPSYADLLREIKGDLSLKEMSKNVTKLRRNMAGNLLLELKKRAETTQVSDAIALKLGESACVVTRRDEMSLEIRDLDELTTPDEVREALGKELEVVIDAKAIKSIRKAYMSTQTAVIQLPSDLARKTLEKRKLRIGWVNCRIREKVDVRKCYKCWAFGHIARDCMGTDMSKCCLQCGEAGHMRNVCKNEEANCILCKEMKNHPTGSFGCAAYQAAMKKCLRKASSVR